MVNHPANSPWERKHLATWERGRLARIRDRKHLATWERGRLARICPALLTLCITSAAVLLASISFNPDPPVATQQARALRPAARISTERPVPGFQSLFQGTGSFLASRATRTPEQSNEPAAEEEEDIEGRNDWFYFQRTYPFTSIPSNARLEAWKAGARVQLAGAIEPLAAKTWRSIGPLPTVSVWYNAWGPTSGRVNSIAVSPADSRIVLLGSSTGGIWRSSDGGESFAPVSDDQVDLAVGSLAFSKSNPSIVYAGMGDTKLGYLGSGVLRSTDAGVTWTRVSNNSLPAPGSISKLEIDPSNSNRLYVAQYSRVSADKITASGVYVSTDGGVNWARTLQGAARDLVIDPANSRTLYAGLSRIDTATDTPFGFYRSTDSGGSWSGVFTISTAYDLTRRRDMKVAVSPANSQRIYTYFGGVLGSNLDAHFRLSTDAGATWTERGLFSVDLAQFGYNSYLACDPNDQLTVYLGSRDLYRTTDGGDSWTNLTRNYYDSGAGVVYAPGSANTHPDQHALAFTPGVSGEFFLGNDGGVSKTTDGGATFQSRNSTMSLSQFTGISVHPTNSAVSYGGTQDNGAQARGSDSMTWYEAVTGDGGHTVINPLDPSIVFMTYVRGEIYRFVGGGIYDIQVASNGSFGEFAATPRMLFYPPFVGNGFDATLYFGTWRLFVSSDLGGSWTAPAGFQDLTKGVNITGADVLSAIAVARSNTNVIYTGSAQGRAMVSTNGGRSWTDVSRGLPDRSITSIAVDPVNPAFAYLTVSGFNSGHAFRTSNMGATWTDISGDLPNIPANALLIDPVSPDTVYVGTDVGVFRSTARGDSWRSFNKGMPPVVVTGFSAQPTGLIQVATYGRGAFEIGGSDPPPVISSVDFNGKKVLTIRGLNFGDTPSVMVNGKDKTERIDTGSDIEIVLRGKAKKLGLAEGENRIQIVSPDGVGSNVVTIVL